MFPKKNQHVTRVKMVLWCTAFGPDDAFSSLLSPWSIICWATRCILETVLPVVLGISNPFYKQFMTSLSKSCKDICCSSFNTLRPIQNGRHFADDVFKCILLNDILWISLKISLKFVPKGLINNIPSLVQIMAWRRPGDKPLSEAMIVSLLTHICVTRPQWVKNVKRSCHNYVHATTAELLCHVCNSAGLHCCYIYYEN